MKRNATILCCVTLFLLARLLPAAQLRYVVQVSVDGLGAKYLEYYVSNAPAQFPTFVRLMQEGAFTFNARCDYDISETVPNHASIFTGRPVLQPSGQSNTVHHGYNNNNPGPADTVHANGNTNVPYKASFFDVAHDYGLSTAFYAGKSKLTFLDRSYDGVNGAVDLLQPDNGKDKIDYAALADISSTSISNEINQVITNLSSAAPYRYTFIHIAEPDVTGHAVNWGPAGWSNAVRMVDGQLGRIMDAIQASAVLSNATALIVSADHGGGGVVRNAHTEAYQITNYTIPFFLWAPGIGGHTDAYALFANRGNPGTNRTDYNTQPQPLRHLDGSNLALGLLGLPPIPGSYSVPMLDANDVHLSTATALDGTHTLWWPGSASAFVLESADTISPSTTWQAITNGLVSNAGMFVYSFTNSSANVQFYRLRKL
ncbi:MAG TPA: alkaline phosphatase family protein [Candidatus Saccharimonadales bacterium]|nr:alkaline phosphatase family protein [Candidatus Saccharimonadales bacterium]